MIIEQDAIDGAISSLVTTNFRGHNKIDLSQEYDKLVEYLLYVWELQDEDELLEYMIERGIKFWMPLPNETPQSYENFALYLQLPQGFRTVTNVSRIKDVAITGVDITEAKIRSVTVDTKLFWEIRANLYDKSFMESLTAAMQDNQKAQIAAMRNRSITLSSLGSDMSMQMLIGAARSFEHMDWENLSPNQMVNVVGAASKLAVESNKLGESALMLSELIETLNELDDISEEELAFLEAKVVSNGVADAE